MSMSTSCINPGDHLLQISTNEDFVYQVENKNVKRSNEMYYHRFTKVIVNFFMTKDPLIPRRNKELNLQKQKQVSRRSKLDLTRQRLLQLLKAKDSRLQQPAKMPKAKGLTVLSEKSSEEEDDDEVGKNDGDDDNDDDDDDDDDADNQDDDGQEDDGQEYDGQDDYNEQTDSDNDGDCWELYLK
ncbi:hypothetical protein Tco_1537641 [Tanacetum coccineum]